MSRTSDRATGPLLEDADARSRYVAQSGEDRLLDSFFGHKRSGVYVEIGAFDGVEMSNTLYFEQIGWTGVLVEADPDLADRCRANRPGSTVAQCAAVAPAARGTVSFDIVEANRGLSSLGLSAADLSRVRSWTGAEQVRRITVPARTIDEILADTVAGPIDFATVDVEGHEADVLEGFDLSRWRPQVVIVERNRTLPDRRVMRHMHRHGYRYTRTTGVNDWFVRTSGGGRPGHVYYARLLGGFYAPRVLRAAVNRLRRLVTGR